MRNAFFRTVSILVVMYKGLYRATALAILLVLSGTADAYGSLRCKGRLIDVGRTAAEVLSLCGKPAQRIVTQVPVQSGTLFGSARFTAFTATELWVYDRGYGKFAAVLHIDEGVIKRIEHSSRRSGAH